ITFPLAPCPEVADGANSSQVVSRRSGMAGRVVLVEDEPLVRRATGRVLRSGGYEVLAFADGEEALAWCKASQEVTVSDRFDIVNGCRIELIGFEVDFPAEVAIRDRKRRRSRCGSVERWGVGWGCGAARCASRGS